MTPPQPVPSRRPSRRRLPLAEAGRRGLAVLGVDRARSRVSAYVYGNVLSLAAVLGADEELLTSGRVLVTVLITTGTTYLAHVLAHDIGERIGRTPGEHRAQLRDELRDATPILTSGLLPCIALGVGALGWWSAQVGQIVAVALIVTRLSTTGWIVARITRDPASRVSWWAGITLAVAGLGVALLKVLLVH